MSYRGKVRGKTVILEPDAELPEGAEVRVELTRAKTSQKKVGDLDPLYRMTEFAVDTGIPDLATNIDHYLYGHPKVTNGE